MGFSVGTLTNVPRVYRALDFSLEEALPITNPVTRKFALQVCGDRGCQVKGLQFFWLEQPFIL